MNTIRENVARIGERIARAAGQSGRPPEDVQLIAISKTFPAATVRGAIEAGLTVFGENRVQEAEAKIRALSSSALEWHLVGHLQSNKARTAARLFDRIHSVDSPRLASRLDQACEELQRTISVLIQVDLGQEESKHGVSRERLPDLVDGIGRYSCLRLDGLMTLPPYWEDPERVRPFFAELRELRDQLEKGSSGCLGQQHLSMGMSHDFEIAIQEGATMVRVGTAIFGARDPRDTD